MIFTKWLGEAESNKTAIVGGKGAQLSRLVQADFPVPEGFCVTTEAFQAFLKQNNLAASRMPQGTALRQKIKNGNLPNALAKEIGDAYQKLCKCEKEMRVAVRSSATAEDLSEASFAGQFETVLGISEEEEIFEAIKRCWSSLWTDRAIAYTKSKGKNMHEIAMAVVVQKMVDAEVSGVLFTVHPVTGEEKMLINASWGLGEAIVSGRVTPDTIVVEKSKKAVFQEEIAQKTVMTVTGERGTTDRVVPLEKQKKAALPKEQILALTELGDKVEEHFGTPQDIEWAIAKGKIYLLQSRPITTLKKKKMKKEQVSVLWGDPKTKEKLKGKCIFWSNWNVRETLPYPLTPLSWSLFNDLIFPGIYEHYLGVRRTSSLYAAHAFLDLVCGRIYWNMNVLYGHPFMGPLLKRSLSQVDAKAGAIFLKLLRSGELQPVRQRLSFSLLRFCAHTSLTVASGFLFLPFFLNRRKMEQKAQRFWESAVAFENTDRSHKSEGDLYREMKAFTHYTLDFWTPWLLAIAYGVVAFKVVEFLTRQWDDIPADKLVAGIPGNKTTETALKLSELANMPKELRQLFRETDLSDLTALLVEREEGKSFLLRLDTFLRDYGHRAVKEFDIALPRWKEDPTFVLQMVKNYTQLTEKEQTPIERFAQKAKERKQLTKKAEALLSSGILNRLLFKKWLFKKALSTAQLYLPIREAPKFYCIKAFAGIRKSFLEIGKRFAKQGVLSQPEDLFFLTLPELETLVDQRKSRQKTVSRVVAKRKAEWRAQSRSSLPLVVRSDGEPVRVPEEKCTGNVLTGAPVSSGRAEGKARVIMDPQGGAAFQKGEILVAPFTDPGWTPLFLTAKALVMEAGGVISHGAIVAREYGIPAVVGVSGATEKIKTGDRLIVDGDSGRVVLEA